MTVPRRTLRWFPAVVGCSGISISLPPGFVRTLDGRYELDRQIGEGGMATVYLAHDRKHQRQAQELDPLAPWQTGRTRSPSCAWILHSIRSALIHVSRSWQPARPLPAGRYSAAVPYRILVTHGAPEQSLDRLVELGTLDVELTADGGLAALLPDAVTPAQVAEVLGIEDLTVTPAIARDAGSVWMLGPRPVHIGRLHIVPEHTEAAAGSLRLIDGPAFGSGFHPTTALCLEMLDEIVHDRRPGTMLDVGTGSGILALSALWLGVPRVTAIDVDPEALTVAARNAELNGLRDRLSLIQGGPDALKGTWSVVVANILAAPLMEMAPILVRRVGHHGELVLSGIPVSLEGDVARAYTRLGMTRYRSTMRGGWMALLLRASW